MLEFVPRKSSGLLRWASLNRLLIFVAVWLCYYLRHLATYAKITKAHSLSSRTAAILARCSSLRRRFWCNLLLSNGLLQTAAMSYRRVKPLETDTQLLKTADGGTVKLEWIEPAVPPGPDAAVLLVFPGNTSDGLERYMRSVSWAAMQLGWRVAVLGRRGCGGLALSTPKTQDLADEADVDLLVGTVKARYPQAPMLGLGFSLGGAQLLRLMTRQPGVVVAAAGLSVPYDLTGISYLIEGTLAETAFLEDKRQLIRRERAVVEQAKDIFVDEICGFQSYRKMYENHEIPVWGYPNLNTMLEAASCTGCLRHVEVPTLLVGAADDPVCFECLTPYKEIEANPNLVLGMTARGGHHAWLGNNPWAPLSWGEAAAMEWLQAGLDISSAN